MRSISGELLAMAVLAAVLLPAGLWLIVTAWRRRKGVGPHCSACDYSLEGLPEDAARCPECGADLSREGAVAKGRRRRDGGRLLTGVALLLPAFVVGGLYAARAKPRPVVAVAAPAPTNRAVARTPPVWVAPPKGPHAGLSDDELADAILADPPALQLGTLLAEAITRARLSSADGVTRGYRPDPWVEKLVRAGLKRQGDPARDWPAPWAYFVESLQSTRHLPHDQWRQYLQQGVRITGAFRKTVEVGSALPFEYDTAVRVSPAMLQRIKCRMISLSLGDASTDEVLRYDPVSPDQFKRRAGSLFSFEKGQWERVEPGQHLARLTILVAHVHPSYTNSTSDWIVRIERKVNVVSRADRSLKYTPGLDEAFARSLRLSADPNSVTADGLRWDGRELTLSLTCVNSPADAHGQLSVDYATTAHIVGYPRWKKGESGTQTFKCPKELFRTIGNRPAKVTLIGQHATGVASLDDTYDWTGTVHYEEVRIVDETKASSEVPRGARDATKLMVYGQSEDGARGYVLVEPATRPAATTAPTPEGVAVPQPVPTEPATPD